MSVHLIPEAHSYEYQNDRAPNGYFGAPRVSVDLSDDCDIVLAFDPIKGEVVDDTQFDRTFNTEEARALAAMLRHYADESDRRQRLR